MKIFLLVSSLNSGGAERVAASLCNAWVERGDEVTLVATYSGREAPFYEISQRVNLVYVTDLIGVGRTGTVGFFRKIIALRTLFHKNAPDVVLSFLQNVNVATLLSTAFLRIPVIACERSDPISQPSSLMWKIACRLTYPFADLVTVQTESAASRLGSRWRWLKRIRAVPNPVPAHLQAPVQRDRFPRRVLLSLGRLAGEKQVDKIITAFSTVAEEFADWDLHVYGDGPQKEALERQIAALAIGNRVYLMGKTATPWEKMAGSDAFVMASRYEGFPNALLEAMAIGLPCIAADCPSGPREISDEGRAALLVSEGDHDQLVGAMRSLLGDGLLRGSIGQKARASVLSRFGLEQVLKKWDCLFTEVGARN